VRSERAQAKPAARPASASDFRQSWREEDIIVTDLKISAQLSHDMALLRSTEAVFTGAIFPFLPTIRSLRTAFRPEHYHLERGSMLFPFGCLPDPKWRIAMVPLESVISPQRATDALVHHRKTFVPEGCIVHGRPQSLQGTT
jgi:hypothetical protein